MRPLRWRWVISLAGMVALGVVGPVRAQDAEADQARALLKHGISQYKARSFTDAQAALLKIDASRLSTSQRKELNEYLDKAREAIRKQAAAMEAYEAGQRALKANELAKARDLFAQAAESEYLPEPVRLDARAQRALVAKKIAAPKPEPKAAPKVTPEPNPELPPVAKPVAKPTVKPVTAPAKKPEAVAASNPPGEPAPKRPTEGEARLAALESRIRRARTEVTLGNEALGREQIDRAIQHFQKALSIAPEYQPARERLAFAQSLVGESGGGAGAISRLERVRRIRKQRTEVSYAQALQRAREAMQSPRGPADFARATQEVQYAKGLLSSQRSLFTDEEYREKKIETDKLLDWIGMEQAAWEKRRVEEQRREVEQRRRRRIVLMQRQKAEKIRTLKSRVRALRDEGRFREAVEILDRIRKLEPQDTWANEWYEQLNRFVLLLDEKEAHRTGLREEHKQFADIRWSQVPWYELLRYPRDWQQITLRRRPFGAGEVAESEANRAVRRKLRMVLPKLEFPGIGFGDVIQFFRDVSDLNIHPKWEALRAANIDEKTPVNVKLTNVSLEKALRTVLDDVGGVNPLDFIVDEGVITISTKDDLSRQTVTRVYDIRDLIFQVPNFEGPRSQLTVSQETTSDTTGTNVQGGGGLFGPEPQQGTTGGTGVGETMSRQELVDSILETIRSTIAPETWRGGATPGMIGSLRELNGQIVVTQTPKNHRELLDLLAQLRETRAILINVEARFIRINSGFLNRIGMNFDFYFNMGTALGGTGTNDPWLGGAGYIPQPNTASGWTTAGHHVPGWNKMTPMHMDLGSFGWVFPVGGLPTAIANSIGSVTATGLTLSGTFLDDVQVDFLLSATQAHESSRTLTCPRVTFFNGQRAYVAFQTQRAYVSDLEPITSENAVAYDPEINVVSTGTVLDVEGTVSADRRYVTLTLRPQVTGNVQFFEYALEEIADVDATTFARAGVVQVPQLEVQQLETTVSIPDRGTILLGGQKLAGEREREMGVPLLSKIPVINRAFTNKVMVRDDETLLILVKPTIVIQREWEEDSFPP